MSSSLTSFSCDQDDDVSWRTRLPIVVGKVVSGVKSGGDETVDTSLEYLRYNITHKPHMFVALPPCDKTDDPQQHDPRAAPQITSQEKNAHALTYWLVGRLLYVLAELDESNTLWEKTLRLVPFLLQTVRSKDPHAFHKVAKEIILTLAELSQVVDKFIEEDATHPTAIKLEHFKGDLEPVHGAGDASNAAIEISTEETAYKLQSALSQVLSELSCDICLFAGAEVTASGNQNDALWATAACQLEFGSIDLKTVTLSLCSRLLLHGGLPCAQALEYYLECLTALIDLLLSGNEEAEGDYEALEKSIVENLDRFLIAARFADPINSHAVYKMVTSGIVNSLILHGSGHLRRPETRACMFSTLTAIMYNVKVKVSQVLPEDSRKELNRALIQEIGCSMEVEYAIRWLRTSILLDLESAPNVLINESSTSTILLDSQTDQDASSSTASEPQTSGATVTKRQKLALVRSSSSLATLPDVASSTTTSNVSQAAVEKSHTVLCVHDRLLQLCRWMTEDNEAQTAHAQLLCGIHGCLEILVWILVKADAQPGKDSDVLNDNTLSALVCIWKSFIMRCCDGEKKELLSEGYMYIVRAISCLIFAQDFLRVGEHFVTFAWILSLNWLPNEMSWMDLKPPQHKELGRICSNIDHQTVSGPVLAECVRCLTLLPKVVAAKWRTHVLVQALSDTRDEVKTAAVQSFPFFLLYTGPNTNHLVYSALHPLVNDKSVAVQRCVVEVCGPLACVVSRKATVNRYMTQEDPIFTIRCVSIRCVSCQHSKTNDADSTKDRPKTVDPAMFLPFVQLVHSPHEGVRMGLVKSIEFLFGHLTVRSANSPAAQLLNTCLELLHDPSYNVRVAFSKVCHHLLPEKGQSDGGALVCELINAKLKQCRKVARNHENCSLSETLNLSAGTLGRHAENEFFYLLLLLLLDSVCAPVSPLAAATAHEQLQLIGRTKQIPMRHLYLRFGSQFSKTVVSLLHQQKEQNPLSMISEVVSVFQFETTQAFFKRTEQFLFPHLVMKATPFASQLTRVIAQQLGDPNHKGPLTRNIRYIFSHLVCATKSDEELTQKFKFLEEESGLSVDALVRCDGWPLMTAQLMFNLAEYKDKVIKGFLMLCKILEGGSSVIETSDGIALLLQDRILAILVQFDNRLNNGTISVPEKTQTYASVISLMELMGSQHVTSVRHRIMTTLKIGLKYQSAGFPELCCKAWNVYVRSIEVSSLGSMLAQITVSLLPLLHQQPQKVAEIFNYLIVENRKNLEDHLQELYFIPDIPELKQVNNVLNKYATTTHSAQSLRAQVTQLLRGIRHESQDVRHHALSKLRVMLHSNQAILHECILASEIVDPMISQIITALLDGCRDSDPALRPMYGQCLGELGAVDPGRLDSLDRQRAASDLRKFQASVTEAAFGFDYLTCLAQAYLRAEERTKQDCVAFAIQELIQVYSISNDPESSSTGSRMWRRFSEEIQEIIQPLMKSQYILRSQYDWSQYPRPFYRSKKGNTFPQWLCALTGFLGSCIGSDEDQQIARVFGASKGVIKNDHQMALYLLPHAVVHVLLEEANESVHDELVAEILAVLNHVKEPETRHSSHSDLAHMAAQTVFSIMDHLQKWNRHRITALSIRAAHEAASRSRGHSSGGSGRYKEDPSYKRISGFLDKIPQETLALASYNCGAYTRALMHHEQYLKVHKQNVTSQQHLDVMQKLYVALDEPDGVTGITAIKHSQPTLNEQILAYESTGKLSDASVCYDSAIRLAPGDLSLRQGLLKCRLALGELNTVLEQANGVLAEKPQWSESLNAYRVEAAWKLGQWDKLSTCLKHEAHHSKNWNVCLGKILLAAKHKNEEEYLRHIASTRAELMGPLSAASMEIGSYQRGYEYIVRLHMLNELEQGMRTLFGLGEKSVIMSANTSHMMSSQQPLSQVLEQWKRRLEYTQYSFRTQEPILNLRRTLLSLAKEDRGLDLDQDIGHCWLSTAKIARESSLVQTAHSSLLSASDYSLPEFCIEKAKWLWDRGDVDAAQICLEKALEEHYPDRSKFLTNENAELTPERIACAQVLLLSVMYSDETSKLESSIIVRQYKEVTRVHPKWEDAFFQIGKYYDKIMISLVNPERIDKRGEFVMHLVQNFGQSLWYGSAHIYQSLPRMLTLWLDYGAEVAATSASGVTHARSETMLNATRSILSALNRKMAENVSKIATYQFLTAFPQLISRICHTHPEVFAQLRELIAKVLCDFPQQSMWGMMAVSKSSYNIRSKRCLEIFNQARTAKPQLSKFLQDSTKLTDRLLDLCNRNCEKGVHNLSISQHFKPLQRLLDDRKFSPIMLPLQSLMTVTLPSGQSGAPANHNPFPGEQIFIRGLEDTVELLASLQRPKKVTMQGSDGKLYIMLCKPKDDLRKDARLMEFNGIVNKFFRKDPEARRRNLLIRTFTVTPLNEECGMLEWVQNTNGLRQILMKLYKERGLYTTGKELQSMQLPPNAPLQRKLDMYKNRLLPKHPAIFSEWFLRTFPDPTSWYNARLAYCRTLAVMSMTGYILGLGDRHGENILMDSTNGCCVHVDFNCLFNKGETFDYPEIVPFRLTHNLVEAMGPMGYEGVFRRSCEVSLRVMQDQIDPLMSVLKSFIYDPLVEWSKPARGRANQSNATNNSGEIKNEMAQTHVSNIDSRLKGLLKGKSKSRGLALSVEGHVNHLIQEATDENNLCQMYLGWAPYL